MREYKDYSEYLEHQASKLAKFSPGWLTNTDEKSCETIKRRIKKHGCVQPGMSVLCLGARTGGEVRGFIEEGCFAAGIDINPGEKNRFVLHGDFHELQFADDSVDAIYTNSVDHVLHLNKFIGEIKRVLKPNGLLILDLVKGTEEGYEPGDFESYIWKTVDQALAEFVKVGFGLSYRQDIGNPWPGEHIHLVNNPAGNPAYVISFPKCGRTWLKVLIGKVLADKYGIEEERLFKVDELSEAVGITPIHFIHDGSSYGDLESRQMSITDSKVGYAGSKVIFMTRDPRDVLVSYFLQQSKREQSARFPGPISEFIKAENFGIGHFVKFHNVWWANRHVPADFMLIKYEELHANTQGALKQALGFLGIDSTDEFINSAVEYASFENMRKLEARDFFNDPGLRPGDYNDPDSYKVRRGKIGGYTDYLTAEDIEYIDQVEREMHWTQTEAAEKSSQQPQNLYG